MKNNNNFKIVAKTIILSMIVFVVFTSIVYAQDSSKNLTNTAVYTVNNQSWAGSTVDDNYQSYWYTNNAANKYFRIESSEPIKYLYVCYAFKPSELVIQTSIDGREWEDIYYEESDEFYHVTYTFDVPTKLIRILGTQTSEGKFGVVEFKVFSDGILPDYIQIWEPSYDTVDMLIFSAHPDDEAVFFSGLIPYYSGEMDKRVAVVYMTASDPCRRSEALNYQWAMHQTHLPIFAYFEDVYEEFTYNYTRSRWGEENTLNYLVSIIREKKPEVIVSHDLNGEYGHGNHIYTAKCLLEAVELANDSEYHPESADTFGIHEVKKLYLHLYPDNQIHMDVFDEPIDEYDGLTAIEIAQVGILQYASQLKYQVVRVHDTESEFSCYDYGLAYTTVGFDTEGNDMFENTIPEPTPTLEPSRTPIPSVALTPALSPATTLVNNNFDFNISKTSSLLISITAGIIFIGCIILIILLLTKKRGK